jgi:hypothetical protein
MHVTLQFRQKPIPCNFFTVPVPLPFKPIGVRNRHFPLQRKQSMKTSMPIHIHNRPDNVLCQPRPRALESFTTKIKYKRAVTSNITELWPFFLNETSLTLMCTFIVELNSRTGWLAAYQERQYTIRSDSSFPTTLTYLLSCPSSALRCRLSIGPNTCWRPWKGRVG